MKTVRMQTKKPLTKKTRQGIDSLFDTDSINAYVSAMDALLDAIVEFNEFTKTSVLCQSGEADAAKPTGRRRS